MAVLTAIALGTMIAGSVVKARAAAKAAKEEQRVAEYNAVQAGIQATDATRRGEESSDMLRRDIRTRQGTQRAGYAAQGVALDSGTPAALGATTNDLLQSDIGRERRNAEREALGFTSQAAEFRRGGAYAKSAGKYNVAASLLGGASDASILAARMDWKRDKPAQKPTPSASTPSTTRMASYPNPRALGTPVR